MIRVGTGQIQEEAGDGNQSTKIPGRQADQEQKIIWQTRSEELRCICSEDLMTVSDCR